MSNIHMWSSALQLVVLHIVRKDLQDTLLLITKLGASKDSILILIPTRTSDMTESRSGQCSHDPRKLDLNLPDPRLRRRGGAATIRSEKENPEINFTGIRSGANGGCFLWLINGPTIVVDPVAVPISHSCHQQLLRVFFFPTTV